MKNFPDETEWPSISQKLILFPLHVKYNKNTKGHKHPSTFAKLKQKTQINIKDLHKRTRWKETKGKKQQQNDNEIKSKRARDLMNTL